METPEGTYIFYKRERDRVKGASMLPTETLRYIEALEKIAYTAYDVWKNTPHSCKPPPLAVDALNNLYDVLKEVDFMEDDGG